jgi:hypothetical protein
MKLFYVVTTLVSLKEFSVDNFLFWWLMLSLLWNFPEKAILSGHFVVSLVEFIYSDKMDWEENLINCGKLLEIHLTIF